ncbi:MAG: hypothetical protein ACPGQL_07330 [Thermoplasmatota archaeon]
MLDKDVNVILAHIRIRGAVEAESDAPEEIRVHAGQRLLVKLTYRLVETQQDQEHWRFGLSSSLGGRTADPVNVEWGDRWGIPDDRFGSLAQTYTMDTPGTYDLEFLAFGELLVGKWGSGQADQAERREVQKTLKVIVA